MLLVVVVVIVIVVIDDVVVIPNKSKVYSLLLVLGLSLEIDNNLGVGVAGEMCKRAKVKSTPSPRPTTGVSQ